MKTWNFNLKSNPKEIGDKLESALGSANGFVFNKEFDENNTTFKVRKRILYGWDMKYHNWTIVNGKLSKTNTENETDVKIAFTQHFLVNFLIGINLFMGLCWLVLVILGIRSNPSMYIVAGIILAIGIVLWIVTKNKFEKDTQRYKTLISQILES